MIKLEHVVLPSPEQMDFVIEGMRNAKNSWDKSDSFECPDGSCRLEKCPKYIPYDQRGEDYIPCGYESEFILGHNDNKLMNQLSDCGPVHSKYMRMIIVYVRITAPWYWWKEFDTYKVGTVSNSCSTMHKVMAKEFTLEDFSHDHMTPRSITLLEDIINELNDLRAYYMNWERVADSYKLANLWNDKKDIWWQIIQLLGSNYNQTRNIMLNYEVLKNIYIWRKDHKLDCWKDFCSWIKTLPYAELITGEHDEGNMERNRR